MKSEPSAPGRWLVIGYGNVLRGDDALGPRIAEEVAAWRRPEVTALAVRQLTPELAARFAGVSAVIFVDASVSQPAVVLREVTGSDPDPSAAHALKPAALLALANRLFGRAPHAWLLTVPARSLDLSDELSESAKAGMAAALVELKNLLKSRAT